MIWAALVGCLLIPAQLVQSSPPYPVWEPIEKYQPREEYYEPSTPSYGEPKDKYYEPPAPSYVEPKYQPEEKYYEPSTPSYGEHKDKYYEPPVPSYGEPKDKYYEPPAPSYGEPKYQPKDNYYEPPAPSYKKPIYPPYYKKPATEYEEHKTNYYGQKEPEFATVLIGDCDKVRGIQASDVYSPNVMSSNVPASPLDTCTKPSGVFFNDSLIVCGGGCAASGTPCYSNKKGCDTWEEMPTMKEYREYFTLTAVESYNALVVVGGFKCTHDIIIFDGSRWLVGPKYDGAHGLVYHSAVSHGPSQVMVIGGLMNGKPTNNVFTIDISNGHVEEIACLNNKRYSHSSSQASWGGNDYIVTAGGFQEYSVSNTVEYIKVSSSAYGKPTWQMLAPMNIKRFNFGLAMYGRKLAAFGGQPPLKSGQIEVYDPVTDCWKMVSKSIAHPERMFFTTITVPESYLDHKPSEIPEYTVEPSYTTPPTYGPVYTTANSYYTKTPSYNHVEPETPDDQEYVTVLVGGCDNDVGITDSEIYSPSLESDIVPASPVPTCTKLAGAFYNGSLVICGGVKEGKGTPCYANEIGSNEWKEFCPMSEHRNRFTMTVVESCNALVVVGGFKTEKDVEIYKDGKWEYGPELREDKGLVHHCSVQYNNKVMVTGGFCGGKPTDMVQTIDIATNQVDNLASLNSQRYAHSCMATSWGGQDFVVVAGGFQGFGVSNTVEYISTKKTGYSEPVWKMLEPMNINRFDFGLGIYGNQLAAFGGQPTIDSEKIEVYRPETKCWKLVGRSIVHPERHFFTTITVPKSYFKKRYYC